MADGSGNQTTSGMLFSIGAVVDEVGRRYPGVTHSSLRFLEREGLIEPQRTPGGHRLYARADVERILWIKEWQRQRLSLEGIRQRLAAQDRLPSAAALAATFLEQALASDRTGARRTILEADELGMPMVMLFGDVLQPVMVEVGHRWADGRLMVSQEKEISELVRELIVEVSLRHDDVSPRGPVLVAACVEGERHELGPRMIASLLRASGYDVHYLGADVAPRFLLEGVQAHRPAAVLLSVRLEENLPALRAAIDVLTSSMDPEELPIIVSGGWAVLNHAEMVEGWNVVTVVADRLEGVIATIAGVLERVDG